MHESVRHVFERLSTLGLLSGVEGKRILEIGPKHGEDSRLLASLGPEMLTLVELPEKRERVEGWLDSIPASVTLHFANLLEMPVRDLGTHDLVWCTGVIYHNPEPLRLLSRLRAASEPGALIVVESEVVSGDAGRKGCFVEIHYPETYKGVPTITNLPTRRALAALLLMAGFVDIVEVLDVYPRPYAETRAVFIAKANGSVFKYYGNDVGS